MASFLITDNLNLGGQHLDRLAIRESVRIWPANASQRKTSRGQEDHFRNMNAEQSRKADPALSETSDRRVLQTSRRDFVTFLRRRVKN
jgi:hypothetical protein